MKDKLEIDPALLDELGAEAARQGVSPSRLADTALRAFLRARASHVDLRPLPTFDSGGMLVDIDDRGELYRAMEHD